MKTFLNWLENWDYGGDDDLPTIRGEYWITEDGGTLYADGDVGDATHDSLVIGHVRHLIADKFNIHYEDDHDWEDTKQEIATQIYEEELKKSQQAGHQHRTEELERKMDDGDYEEFYLQGCLENGISETEQEVAEGNGDPREYGMEVLGWKRVADHNIETWTFNTDDISAISTGLGDIIQDGEPEQIEQVEIYIYVYSNQQSHSMTIGQLDEIAGNTPPQSHPTPAAHPAAQPPQPGHAAPAPQPTGLPTEPPKDPLIRLKQLARDRHDGTLDYNIKGAEKAGQAYSNNAGLSLMHPYYANKNHPFADWTFRNYGKVL